MHEQIYGRQGQTSANFLNAPSRFYSRNTRWEFNVDKANQVLDAAGWKRGADGIREKDGKRLKMVYQTSINAPRQKNQQIVKQAAAKAGIDLELKSVVASVFFGSDPANPDNYPHFYADLQMYNTTMTAPDPQYFMNQFTSWEVASKANKWQGRNVTRWRNEEYDRTYDAADVELDPVKRAALFIKMNDLVIQNVVVIPVLWRTGVSASTNKLRGMDLTGLGHDHVAAAVLVQGGLSRAAVLDFPGPGQYKRAIRSRRRPPDPDHSQEDASDGRAWTERADRRGEGRAPEPARLRPDDGRARPDGAHGGPDAGLGRRRPGADQAHLQGRPSGAAAARSRRSGGRARRCSTRTSPSAPRTRTARASSTSRWPAGIPTATSSPILAAEIPTPAERRRREGRQVGHLEAQEGRAVARRQALHRRRRRLQLGVRVRSRDRRRHHRHLQGRQGRRRSTATRSRSRSRSRRRSGRTPSSACAA